VPPQAFEPTPARLEGDCGKRAVCNTITSPDQGCRLRKCHDGVNVRERINRLLTQFAEIHAAVCKEIDGIPMELPNSAAVSSLSSLKRYEDGLDAVVCGWVAAQFVQGNTMPYGDATAAVWVPRPDCHSPARTASRTHNA
jgi:hypothetical protein